jgi:hypothetical protein
MKLCRNTMHIINVDPLLVERERVMPDFGDGKKEKRSSVQKFGRKEFYSIVSQIY